MRDHPGWIPSAILCTERLYLINFLIGECPTRLHHTRYASTGERQSPLTSKKSTRRFCFKGMEFMPGMETYTEMNRFKRPYEAYIFQDEYHMPEQPRRLVATQERNLDWFRFWLQGYEDPDFSKRRQYERWERLCRMQREEPQSHSTRCQSAVELGRPKKGWQLTGNRALEATDKARFPLPLKLRGRFPIRPPQSVAASRISRSTVGVRKFTGNLLVARSVDVPIDLLMRARDRPRAHSCASERLGNVSDSPHRHSRQVCSGISVRISRSYAPLQSTV